MSNQDESWKVAANSQKQYSIWPAAKPLPAGWQADGKTGTQQECKSYILQLKKSQIDNETELGDYIEKPMFWPSVTEHFIYDDVTYNIMTSDSLRNYYYKVALQGLAKDRVVIDIGTGRDAILARFCVEAGASRVYAIEYIEPVYRQAVQNIRSLGLEDKIILIQGDSREIVLPEKADLIVTEILGHIASQEGIVNVLNDARKRHLKNDGHVVPYMARTHIAAIKLPDTLLKPAFELSAATEAKKLFNRLGYPFDVRLNIRNFPPDHIVSTFGLFEYLDFSTLISDNSTVELRLHMLENSTIDGFLLWLNLETKQDVFINTLGNQHLGAWSPVYFPVFEESIYLSKDDFIEIKCTRNLSENNLNPNYFLEGCIVRTNQEKIPFAYSSKFYNKDYKSNKFYKQLFENDTEEGKNLIKSLPLKEG